MRASERKNKNPSEYSNPYFKRGKPNLLWLIHKPKNGPSKGGGKGNTRAKQEDAEEEADDFLPHESPAPPVPEHAEEGQNPWSGRQPLALPPIEGRLPPEQFKSLQQEMAEIRLQQRKITEMLNAARRENMQIYNQAKAFHELHEKHDNSINAILTFLASVYKNNMHDKGLDFRNMFGANTLPSKEDGHEIINVSDNGAGPINNPARAQYAKKKPLLLKDKASPPHSTDSPKALNQWPASTFAYPDKPKRSRFRSPAIQEIHDQTLSNRGSQSPQANHAEVHYDQGVQPDVSEESVPPSDILSVIQKQNAQNTKLNGTQMEFPEALSHLQNTDGQAPLTPSQRQNMLRLMSDEQANTPANANYNNALTSYNPPDPAATLAHFSMNSEQLSQIQESLRQQEARMANIQANIAPLSPSGSIPGVNDQTYNGNPELDLDSIFNTGDYFNDGSDPNNFDFTNGTEFPNFDFGAGGENANGDAQEQGLAQFDGIDEGRVKEMDSSEATSPANTVQTIDEEDHPEQKPRKLRRRN